ncbi:hypothetical protein LKL35_08115 [Streptomyces sp. ET3-23]|uniref:YwqJ-related putative deaminase n=1 Tax=Streptomyces sp. ET3-23 TaxID=2885643 RepID=UPI001D12DAF9|nr:YwqJ-related putative deaminase [Streptomyces sp. ET3-23]MCC2275385.1 hypothetical protein [Streptomyces sp. ET3-23]
MIEPEKIPHYTGNFDQLEKDAAALKKTASSIRSTGRDIHSTFQGLDPVYEAPEKGPLLHTTVPVREGADHFASKLETVGGALSDFAHTGRPLAKRMDELRREAEAFAKSVADDKHWQRDAKKQKENAHLVHEVGRVWGEFQEAERSTADKISALVGNTRWVPDDGSHKPGMYGFSADDAAKADKTPWGTADAREYTGVKWLWHHGTHFVGGLVTGFFKDGILDTLKGLGHMVNFFDWDTFAKTWSGIGDVVTGIGLYTVRPFELAMNAMGLPDKPDPDSDRARKAAREFGKSLVAWDQWKRNPGRAIGTVVFNGLTLGAGPLLKLGKAGELGNLGKAGEAGGKAAKVAGALGRAGQLVDPMTYIGGAAKYAKVQVGDLLKSLKETHTGRVGDFLDGASKPSGALADLPKGFHYTNHEGQLRVITEDGKILDEHGKPAEPPAVKEPHKADLPNVHETSPSDHRVPAGVGASHPQASAHAGGGTADGAASHTGSRAGDSAGYSGSASHTPNVHGDGHSTSTHSGHDAPSRTGGHNTGSHGGHYDHGPTAHGHDGPRHADDNPSHHAGEHDTPSGDSHGDGGTHPHHEGGSGHPTSNGAHENVDHSTHNADGSDLPSGSTGLEELPPPGPGEKVMDRFPEGDPRVKRTDGLVTQVNGRPVADYLDDLSQSRGAAYRDAKEAGTFPRKQTGACVGVVMDLRTGSVIEGINGKAANIIPLDQLHPTLRERYEQIADNPPHRDHPLGHAEVKAVNELLWERHSKGLPDGKEALAEMRASVEFPYLPDKVTGAPGRRAPYCANCGHMIEEVPSSHGRYTDDPPTDDNWIPG